jgi:metal-dependent hydrolase (beta-lactamase superfamily II)
MNKEQQELLGDAYKNWCRQFEVDPNNFDAEELSKGHNDQCWGYPILDYVKPTSKEYKRGQINAYLEGKAEKPFFYLTQEEFINICKTDNEFAKTWGLKIEERELSLEEKEWQLEKTNCINDIENDRIIYGHKWEKYIQEQYEGIQSNQGIKIPTKQITITYNDKKIESYE